MSAMEMAGERPAAGSTALEKKPVRMKVAKALLECLRREGVEVIFGYPGGAILHVYDALFHEMGIRHILVRHEQGGTHAADGYARATGKPGVVFATSGPGATNVVTGLATAFMDSIPMVVVTGQVPTYYIGKDAFQEADICGVTMPITKHNYLVRDAKELPRIVREAFHIATTGRPGPVLIDLPKDISNMEIDFEFPETVDIPGYRPTVMGHPRQIAEAAKAIGEAERPVLYVGGGAISSGAHEEVRALAEKCGLPVAMTLMGLGSFPGNHPQSLGMLGMHGSQATNWAITECDLLIAAGARFDDRVTGDVKTFAPNAKIIHIDIDPAEISKNVTAHIPIVGDLKQVLEQLVEKVEARRCDSWWNKLRQWQTEYPLIYDRDATDVVKPQFVIEQLSDVTRGKAVITTDVGQHQMWVAQFFKFEYPRTNVTSGGLGTMGFGFPAAIGAHYARPDLPAIAVTGDGGFQMNIQELATVASYKVPVKVIIINNCCLGMVRQWQETFYNKRYSQSVLFDNPDFVKVSEAFGVKAMRVDKKEDVRPALEAMLAYDGPIVLDIMVDQEENVLPMVPPGGSISQMIGIRGRTE